MTPVKTRIDGFVSLRSTRLPDARGSLTRLFDSNLARTLGIGTTWKQILQSQTTQRNTLRGLHVQLPPYPEAKLVSCQQGRMFWVVVDVRPGSPTFGQWDALTLTGEVGDGFYAGPGLAHGCLSLSDDVLLTIASSEDFKPEFGAGIHWQDPEIGVSWPTEVTPMLSDAHSSYPSFAEFRRTQSSPEVREAAHA
jgi:dTDP-4-dehydrorhamnose 3,5-epimerase